MPPCLDCDDGEGGRYGLCPTCSDARIDRVRSSIATAHEQPTEQQTTLGAWGA